MGIDKKVTFEITFRNKGAKTISGLSVNITCFAVNDVKIKSYHLNSNSEIKPGETNASYWEVDTNMFDSEEQQLYDTPQTRLHITHEITRITFDDGSEIRLLDSF